MTLDTVIWLNYYQFIYRGLYFKVNTSRSDPLDITPIGQNFTKQRFSHWKGFPNNKDNRASSQIGLINILGLNIRSTMQYFAIHAGSLLIPSKQVTNVTNGFSNWKVALYSDRGFAKHSNNVRLIFHPSACGRKKFSVSDVKKKFLPWGDHFFLGIYFREITILLQCNNWCASNLSSK